MAARIAERVVPLLPNSPSRSRTTLEIFRFLLVSFAARTLDKYNFELPLGEVRNSLSDLEGDSSAFAILAVAAAARAATIKPHQEYIAQDLARADVVEAAGRAASAMEVGFKDKELSRRLWKAVAADAEWLLKSVRNSQAVDGLMYEPLWPEHSPSAIFSETIDFFIILGDEWRHWRDWYQRRLRGATGFGLPPNLEKQFLLRLADEPENFWDQRVDIVNKNIAARLDEAWQEAADQERAADSELIRPDVPAQQPAMIQPTFDGRILDLPAHLAAHESNVDPKHILNNLRYQAQLLLDCMDGDNGVSYVEKSYIKGFLDIIPSSSPREDELHTLGAAEHTLQIFGRGEAVKYWQPIVHAQFITCINLLDSFMAKFPSWRMFEENSNKEVVESTDVEAVGYSLLNMQISLNNSNLIQPGDRLEAVVTRQANSLISPSGLPLANPENARNALEGQRNIIKVIYEKIAEGVENTISEEARGLGEDLIKVIFGVARGFVQHSPKFLSLALAWGAASLAGMDTAAMLTFLMANPDVLAILAGGPWLLPLVKFLARLAKKENSTPKD